ncbi:hypothetical protein T492DRAFT_921644, partial [Pavlovales sp. CCMP2436]
MFYHVITVLLNCILILSVQFKSEVSANLWYIILFLHQQIINHISYQERIPFCRNLSRICFAAAFVWQLPRIRLSPDSNSSAVTSCYTFILAPKQTRIALCKTTNSLP